MKKRLLLAGVLGIGAGLGLRLGPKARSRSNSGPGICRPILMGIGRRDQRFRGREPRHQSQSGGQARHDGTRPGRLGRPGQNPGCGQPLAETAPLLPQNGFLEPCLDWSNHEARQSWDNTIDGQLFTVDSKLYGLPGTAGWIKA